MPAGVLPVDLPPPRVFKPRPPLRTMLTVIGGLLAVAVGIQIFMSIFAFRQMSPADNGAMNAAQARAAAATDGPLIVAAGPGSGKTTLLELLAGLRTPSDGAIRAEGALLGDPGSHPSSPTDGPVVHLVTQRPFLVPGTIRDNLTLGSPAPRSDAHLEEALRAVGLHDLVARGLDTPLGDEGFGLSAGQRARLAIARAGLSDADVLLLDEPTAHLDPDAEAAVHAYVTGLAADRIVVAVSHRRGLVERADAELRIDPLDPTDDDADVDVDLDVDLDGARSGRTRHEVRR